MSQQKDSDQGANRAEPTDPSVPEPTPESAAPADSPQAAPAAAEISESSGDYPDATAETPDMAATAPLSDDVATVKIPAAPTVNPTAEIESSSAAVDSNPTSADSESSGFDLPKAVTLTSVVLLVVALIFAGWLGGTWIFGGLVQDKPRADAREHVLTDARQAAINLMSFNPDDIDGSLANIRSSMTGDLLKQQEQGQDQLKQTATDSKTRIVATVEGITVTSLNSERDHASAFAVLKITRTWPGGQPASFRQLWTLDMVKQGSTWKAEKAQNLGEPVPLGSGAPQQNAAPQPGDAPQPSGAPQPAAPQTTANNPQPGN
ncbi:hypothetical protein ACIP5Y_16830 [Nocardia sp. NPDC088792]|uniref:hypothetical protein n=1 Tax=Nocardia sp. NPDC088792 TaxID=3364332 RepID=UPI0037F38EF3